jgi:hypothetical protein
VVAAVAERGGCGGGGGGGSWQRVLIPEAGPAGAEVGLYPGPAIAFHSNTIQFV